MVCLSVVVCLCNNLFVSLFISLQKCFDINLARILLQIDRNLNTENRFTFMCYTNETANTILDVKCVFYLDNSPDKIIYQQAIESIAARWWCHLLIFRFSNDPKGLLVSSDVAARGLDILNVDHVIHYQVPHNAEVITKLFVYIYLLSK